MSARIVTGILIVLIGVSTQQATGQDASRYPLMTIEQHRASVVKAIVDKWSDAFAVLPGGEQRSADQLGNELYTLRADRLLAASLAGTYITVAEVLQQSRAETAGGTVKPRAKALGDAADDLTYTPVTPCRIVDTRNTGGALAAGVNRTFVGFAGSFASQGGVASSCDLPNGIAALSLNVAAVQPQAAGFITLWPANVSRPSTGSTLNYAAGAFATATGTIAPVDPSNNQFSAWSPAGVDMVVDVVGYFQRPAATALDCVATNTTVVSVPAGAQRSAQSPACVVGFALVSGSCLMDGGGSLNTSRPAGNTWNCYGNAPATMADTLRAAALCCRIPGH